jgi:hypothetical protein
MLGPLADGDPAAVQKLWERYFHRLVGLARAKLQNAPRRAADEEDVALSAFDSFCRNAGEGRFPDLLDRDGLWRLLMVITARKAAHLKRDETRQKRGGGATQLSDDGLTLEYVLSEEPTPEMAAEMAEEYRRLLLPAARGRNTLKNRLFQSLPRTRDAPRRHGFPNGRRLRGAARGDQGRLLR